MFNQGGLSLEQAPPISVVMRFFITASLFGVLLGLTLFTNFTGMISFNQSNMQLIIVHTLALGIMASFMLGALFQMLPVIAGVIIQTPTQKAMIVHVLLIVGLIMQLFAFNMASIPLLYLLAASYLGVSLLYALIIMIRRLLQIKDHSSSSKGILFALGSFVLAIIFGIYLLLTLGGYIDGLSFLKVKELHYTFALFGWISLLIISISFQVIEMFYITPKYPTFFSNYLLLIISILLMVKSFAIILNMESQIITLLLSAIFIAYAAVTLHRLYHRKRPTSDATVWFWRLGMGLLIVSMLILLINTLTTLPNNIMFVSYITFIGFALSIVFAMVYKIVPFLTWFHLSNQGYIEAPMMHDVIHPKKAKTHFKLHVSMLISWLGAVLLEEANYLIVFASLLVIASFGWLLYHLILAVKKYNYVQKHTEKVEW